VSHHCIAGAGQCSVAGVWQAAALVQSPECSPYRMPLFVLCRSPGARWQTVPAAQPPTILPPTSPSIITACLCPWPQIARGEVADYAGSMRSSKFCLSPYGYGFGFRTSIYMAHGCVPVVLQDHVFQVGPGGSQPACSDTSDAWIIVHGGSCMPIGIPAAVPECRLNNAPPAV
jgi:hypothetical protein